MWYNSTYVETLPGHASNCPKLKRTPHGEIRGTQIGCYLIMKG